ncbi:MAG: peptidoglycan-binding domain-containing protein [bacterium]
MFTQRFYNLLIIITLAGLLPGLVLAVTNIDGADKYAWSEKIGWINFGTGSGNVQVTNTALSGYAWHSEYGWINLAPNDGGVVNNGSGILSGRAWGEGTGWINFSGVSINTEGYWSGYANGDITGKISFNCANSNSCTSSNFKVKTSWRKTAPVTMPTPVAPSTSAVTTATTASNNVVINDGSATTNQRNVILHFTVGNDIKYMAISNTNDFATASLEIYQDTVNWTLADGVGAKTIYAKLYTALGQANTLTATVNYQTTATTNTTITPTPTSGFADGNLVKEKNSSAVYLIDNGKKRLIPSAEVFNAQGLSWSQVIEVTDLSAYETGWPVTTSTSVKATTATTPTTITNSIFTKDLTLGDINPEVKLLQQFLNQQGYTIADSGSGSQGRETEKFGRGTFNALIKWQEKYKAEVLTPAGFKKATGIFGPASRALASKLMVATPATTTPPPVASVPVTTKTDLPSAKFDTNLDSGMTNADVTRLQKLLASQSDVYPEGKITGFFGEATKLAVQRFQLKYKITTIDHPAYGYVGPGTRAKLLEVFGQ